MYNEQIQEKGCNTPPAIHQPELAVIIERLQNAVNCYGDIVHETKIKLQMIKKYNELSKVEKVEEKKPESATEEINRLISILNELNERAEENLRHLRGIV